MLADRIRKVLKRRPYWGAETIAENLGTSAKVIRVVASKHEIKLMTRYEVEKYMDPLVDAVEKLGGPDGEA
jgi:hypothetical protein